MLYICNTHLHNLKCCIYSIKKKKKYIYIVEINVIHIFTLLINTIIKKYNKKREEKK